MITFKGRRFFQLITTLSLLLPAGWAISQPAPTDPTQGLPPGHPPLEQQDDLPPGHPPAGGAGARRPGFPRQSEARPDPSQPRGTIVIEVKNGVDDTPMAGIDVIMGTVAQSVAKGDTRKRDTARTDEKGLVKFSNLATASNTSYRISTVYQGATYAATPFQLSQTAMRVTLMVYPASNNVSGLQIASQGILFIELRDDVFVIEQGYRIFNLGTTTWLAAGTQLPLPKGFKAFNSQQGMSDVGFDASTTGATLRGSITPGQHDVAFRYHVPFENNEDAEFDIGLLPNVQMFRVITDAPKGMVLDVPGFPQPEAQTNQGGQKILITEKETPRPDPGMNRVKVRLHNLPTRPWGRWVAVGVATAFALGGLGLAYTPKPQPKKGKKGKQAKGKNAEQPLETKPSATPEQIELTTKEITKLLRDLDAARARGDIGPKTYESERQALIDQLAALLVKPVDNSVDNPSQA